jgi:hypothetical protein
MPRDCGAGEPKATASAWSGASLTITFCGGSNRFVDLSEVRAHLGPYYSDVGRASIDPELLIRMLLVGYCLGIRSERRLCEEVHLNLDIRLVFPSGNEKTRPEAASAQLSIGVKSGSPLAIARRYAGRSPMRCR